MKLSAQFLLTCLIIGLLSCTNTEERSKCRDYQMTLIEPAHEPLIDKNHPGSEALKRGYEGGTILMQNGILRLFITEMPNNNFFGTRTGYWESNDGVQWQRIATLQESVKDTNSPRNSVWSPMPFYNRGEQRWNLIYVGYEVGGIRGRIFRAGSDADGEDGIAGPYSDLPGTLMSYQDEGKAPWESLQGADSFFAFPVGDKWYAFYGSSDAETRWDNGLAFADSLAGPWKRDTIMNPTFTYSENPIVSKLDDGTYFCVYDDLSHGEQSSTVGYGYSTDGVNWKQKVLKFPMPGWANNIRTPEGLIPVTGERDVFWLYFTAGTPSGFHNFTRMKVRISEIAK